MASWLGSPAFVAACTTSLCPKAPRLVLQNVICLRTFVPFQPAATASSRLQDSLRKLQVDYNDDGRRSLALVSKTPGKTVCINFFLINEKEAPWYMVDLPGYGYAKRSKTSRFEWNKFTKKYFLERETLANVLLLLDSTIPPQEVDLSCADWLAEAQIPFSLVFTKVDKRKKKCPPPEENIQAFIDDLRQRWDAVPPVFATSGVSGVGKQELLTYLAQLRQLFVEQHAEL
ncbi:hypothetical protein WJX72_007363 [[Myrmecia] bisecta]|uniref:EngB-type G domain-containing protein n=1 Tax=[Myrmecia] bisecta TaxID=41462 RepID=A0AAW1PDB5_9CHLO